MMIGIMTLCLGIPAVIVLLGGAWRARRNAAQRTAQVRLNATEVGDVQKMRNLLAKGIAPRARNALGWTLLHVAAARGDATVVALLSSLVVM